MSILFLLLKIIAVILAVILAFLFLCLFHPVFYQVEGILKEDAKPVVQGKFWWLFQILRLEILFSEGELSLKVRIFGIGKKLFREKDGEDSREDQKSEQSETNSGTSSECISREDMGRDAGEPVENKSEILNSRQENLKDSPEDETKEQKKREFRHRKRKRKKQDTRERKNKSGVFSSIKRELSDEKNKMALSHVWREILYLLSHLKPKYAKGEIHFSTGDPALTGEVTGVLSLFPVFYRYKLHVYPDFASDGFYIRGNLSLKGHISLYHFILILIRLFADKNIRGLIKKIRK